MSQVFVPKIKHEILNSIAVEQEKIAKKQRIEQLVQEANSFFKEHRWWKINGNMLFDRKTGLLWQQGFTQENSYDNVKQQINNSKLNDLNNWQLPTIGAVQILLENDNTCPLRKGSDKRIINDKWNYIYIQQIGQENAIWLDKDFPKTCRHNSGVSIAIHYNLVNKKNDIVAFFMVINRKNWDYAPYYVASDDSNWKKFAQNVQEIVAYYKNGQQTPTVPLDTTWANIDYISTRLPKLENLRFTDIEQGMWEFYAPEAIRANYVKIDNNPSIRARNPEKDIQDGAKVAIDFGTSSTVVAIRKNGRDELLRIGMQESDFKNHDINENDFENPTILELLDIEKLLKAWHSEPYRPLVDWATVHCSHEARTRMRENDTDPKMMGSMFARLKQWALRDAEQAKVRLTDSQNHTEYEFDILKELNPVKGQPITLNNQYPQLDPIELYAWFLGMNINWRERGIFLKYYMTFPVAYPNEVKEKILASFRRGLQRSLPESLIYSERFQSFSVQELASEPSAFASSALSALNIEPTQEGVAYAVFDFGGGTTDFDYGIYRLPTDEEFDEGYDEVIEHFGSSGDKFLGGENLLENLAYLVFKHNQNTCRENEISFTKPIDADNFVGSERLISQTQSAFTNTNLLMSKLRPLWEAGQIDVNNSGTLNLKLLNRHGEKIDCTIQVPQQELIEWLQERIRQGLGNFFTAMKVSFENQLSTLPDEVHILLAGNSSRSKIVLSLLGLIRENSDENQVLSEIMDQDIYDIFDENNFEFIVHPPLQSDPENPYKPNTKTGVALGLLKVSPGETLKVINHAQQNNTDSPFQFFVGSHRRNIFTVGLKRGDEYGKWAELGVPRQGIFPLLYTTQPQALNNMERGATGLFEKSIEFVGQDIQGKKVFAKILSPNEIALALAESISDTMTQYREIKLDI